MYNSRGEAKTLLPRGIQMHIHKITLTNFRGATSLSICLHEHLNVIIGENGTGKSTVLDAIAIMLSWIISGIRGNRVYRLQISEDDISNNQGLASLEIICMDIDNNKTIKWRLEKGREKSGSLQLREEGLIDYTKRIQHSTRHSTGFDYNQINIPIFVYYPLNRAVLGISHGTVNTSNQMTAYDNALTKGADFKNFFKWFRTQEDIENERKIDEKNYDYVDPQLQAVRTALQQILPEFTLLTVKRNPLRMEVDKKGKTLTFDQLSDGERCMIFMVSDLARRMIIANPRLKNPLEGKGIILIDEIDLHLHPHWQRMIIPKLTNIFPACQFIFSTHSPSILTHVHPENVFLLKLEKGVMSVSQPSNSYGKTANRILEDLMELDTTRPEKIESDICDIYQMIDNNELDSAKREIAVIKELIGDDPELTKAEVIIKRKELIGK